MSESGKLLANTGGGVISPSKSQAERAGATVLGGIPHKDDYDDYNSSISFKRNPNSRYAKQAKQFADRKAAIELTREGNMIYATNTGKERKGKYLVGWLEKGKANNGAPAVLLRYYAPENALEGLRDYPTTVIHHDQDLKSIAVNHIYYSKFWKMHKAK